MRFDLAIEFGLHLGVGFHQHLRELDALCDARVERVEWLDPRSSTFTCCTIDCAPSWSFQKPGSAMRVSSAVSARACRRCQRYLRSSARRSCVRAQACARVRDRAFVLNVPFSRF